MSNVKTLKGISFRATFSGTGCVNFDSDEQVNELYGMKLLKGKTYNNVKFAKKIYRKNGDGSWNFKYKVSSEKLRHEMFKLEMPYDSQNKRGDDFTYYRAIATPALVSRGYMSTEDVTLKKKSPLGIEDAIEVGEFRDVISFDFHSRSGAKKVKEEDDEKSDTSIYKTENVGKNKYVSEGFIDMQELQFLSADPSYDRMGIDVDGGVNETTYLNALNRNFPSKEKKFGYYYIKNAITEDEWAEYGILLTNDDVDFLVKYLLKKILNIHAYGAGATFNIEKLEISFDYGETYREIKLNELNDYYFDVICKYQEASADKIRANRAKMEEIAAKKKEEKKSNKKSNKTAEEE